MKRKQYTTEQIIGFLKAHEAGIKVADLTRKHGFSEGRPAPRNAIVFQGVDAPVPTQRCRTYQHSDRCQASDGQ